MLNSPELHLFCTLSSANPSLHWQMLFVHATLSVYWASLHSLLFPQVSPRPVKIFLFSSCFVCICYCLLITFGIPASVVQKVAFCFAVALVTYTTDLSRNYRRALTIVSAWAVNAGNLYNQNIN